jgi:hypothetical protein
MTGGVTIDLSQFQPILKKFSTLSQELQAEIDGEIHEAARSFAGLAKAAAPADTGRLRGSINFAPAGTPLSYEVFAQTTYAAYQEFGTIQKVSVPPDLVEVAAKYKGRGIRKKGGVRARAYFFSQRAKVIPELMNNLNNVIEQTLGK